MLATLLCGQRSDVGGLIGLMFLMPLFGMALGAGGGAAGGAMSDDKILPHVEIPGEVIQTSLSDESETALQEAHDAARN